MVRRATATRRRSRLPAGPDPARLGGMPTPGMHAYYARGGEHHRLAAGAGRLEFLRTRDLLARALPPPPARVLDVGGATGAYAGPLAADGYAVLVVDPVAGHADAAAARPGVTAVRGDARALPVADGCADAVLVLGPLYHLDAPADRALAWREAARAVRPGGVVAGAAISRFASLLDGVAKGYGTDPGFAALVDRALTDGVHAGGDGRFFTDAYFHRPDEPAAEAAGAGLVDARTAAVEGPAWLLGPRLDDVLADPGLRGYLLAALRRVEHEPSLLGASSHLLTTARRPAR